MNLLNRNNLFKNPQTNWKYISILIILAFLVGGGIFGYQWWIMKEEIKMPEIKIPEKVIEEKTVSWKTYQNEVSGFEIKYPENWSISSFRGVRDIILKKENCEFGIHEINREDYEDKERIIKQPGCSSEEIVINDISFIKIICAGEPTWIRYYFQRDGEYFYISEISRDLYFINQGIPVPPNAFAICLKDFDQILSSFRFTRERILGEKKIKDPISKVEIIARENKLDKRKTDIFIKDLRTNKEEFFVSGFDFTEEAEFRNRHLYIAKDYVRYVEIWKYSSPRDKGTFLYRIKAQFSYFTVSPDEAFIVHFAEDPLFLHSVLKDYEGPGFISDGLIFVNLVSGEEKEIYNFATDGMISYVRELPPYALQHYINILSPLQWSSDSKNLWGRIDLCSSADPPVPVDIAFFKINVENWEIKKFEFPSCAVDAVLNVEKETVLYDCINSELSLRLRNLSSGEEEIIVSYPSEIVSKYLESPFRFSYRYIMLVETTVGRLEPRWIDNNTISYLDFETREEVIKKIE